MVEKKDLYTLIDKEAQVTVGIMCKRVELLEHNKSFTPTMFKALSKEIIYEQSRTLKRMVNALYLPKIIFKTQDQ